MQRPAIIVVLEFLQVKIHLQTVPNFKEAILTIHTHSLLGVLEHTRVQVLPPNLLNHPVVEEVLQAVDQFIVDNLL